MAYCKLCCKLIIDCCKIVFLSYRKKIISKNLAFALIYVLKTNSL